MNEKKIRIGKFKSRTMGTWHITVLGDGYEFCTCAGWLYNRKCWHLDTLKAKPLTQSQVIDMPAVKIEELILRVREYKSSLNALNELFGGNAYSTSEIVALYGLPNVGKTLLSIQESFWMASNGINVLYVDTEGSMVSGLRAWQEKFSQRFQKKADIYAVYYPNLEDLMQFMGHNVEASLKGSKVEVVAESIKGESEFEKTIRENNIGFVVIDSISAPIRNKFPSAQQNFPARADITGMIYATLMRAQRHGVAILTIHHATMNPANPYETHADLRGGITVHYFSKRIIYMDKRDKKGLEDIRRFWLVRSPGSREWSMVRFAKIDPAKGLVDEPARPEYLTDGERRTIEEGLISELLEETKPQSHRQARKGK